MTPLDLLCILGPAAFLWFVLGMLPYWFTLYDRGHLRWTLHNLLGHPIAELLHLVGLPTWGWWVHDRTLPAEATEPPEDYRP